MNKRIGFYKLGIRSGDIIKVTSASCPDGVWKLGLQGTKEISGKAKVTESMRPGVVGFFLGSGHLAYGSKDVTVDGATIKGDARRGKGIHANVAMRVDPVLKNTGLQDLVGGSICFYDTKVKLIKI